MRLAGRHLVAGFMHDHGETRTGLGVPVKGVREASWSGPAALRERYPSASLVREGVVVFRVMGAPAAPPPASTAPRASCGSPPSARTPSTIAGGSELAHLIHDDHEHAEALRELDRLLDAAPEPGTPEPDELQLLALVIEMYEERRWPMELADPVDAILFVMDERGSRARISSPTWAAGRGCRRCLRESAASAPA